MIQCHVVLLMLSLVHAVENTRQHDAMSDLNPHELAAMSDLNPHASEFILGRKFHNLATHLTVPKKFAALCYAIEYEYNDIALQLLTKCPNVAQIINVTRRGRTLLHLAASHRHNTIVEVLLNKNADMNIEDDSGRTPLHLATLYARYPIVEMLVNNNANTNIGRYAHSPLHLAVMDGPYGNNRIVKMLLKYNTDVNIRDNEGRTPLHHSMNGKKNTIVMMLLKYNADSNIRDNSGKTALDLGEALDQKTQLKLKSHMRMMVKLPYKAATSRMKMIVYRKLKYIDTSLGRNDRN